MSRISEYDIGCEPSPSIPAELLIQDGFSTYLLFWASTKEITEKGYIEDLGVAIVECQRCIITKFGYPNDEGLNEHPLYQKGLGNSESDILLVADSSWLCEVESQRSASRKRIWEGRNFKSKHVEKTLLNHFIICLKEKTFECISENLKVVKYTDGFDEAIKFVYDSMKN